MLLLIFCSLEFGSMRLFSSFHLGILPTNLISKLIFPVNFGGYVILLQIIVLLLKFFAFLLVSLCQFIEFFVEMFVLYDEFI
jgi:hypothetical protein